MDSQVGPVVPVAETSRVKPIATGMLWAALGLLLLAGATLMLAFELPRLWRDGPDPEWQIVGIAVVFLLVSFPLLATLVRRIRVIYDPRLFFRAGPGGISVCYPRQVNFRALLLSYRIEQYDLPLDLISAWYPYLGRLNGIPVYSQIVFEGNSGWGLAVDTLFFTGTRKSIADNIASAIQHANPAADAKPPQTAEQKRDV
jgi:hypothetical protein